MVTAFLPFPTGILAEALRAPEHTAQIAVVLYGITVLAIELILQTLTRYAAARPRLADQPEGEAREVRGPRWLSPVVALYLVAVAVGIVGLPKLAAALYLLLAIPSVVLMGSHRRGLRRSDAAPR
jgi:hypothetical protein